MATKIYISNGGINIDDGVDDLVVINPRQFDWKISNLNYSVRDKIDNQSYALGVLADIQNEEGNTFATSALLTLHLNGLMKGESDVAIQDQTTPDISLYLGQNIDNFTLESNRAVDDESFNIVTTGVVPAIGNFIFLKEVGAFSQLEILSVVAVAGNEYTVTVSMPLDYAYTTSAIGELQNVNMNIDGTIPKKFHISLVGLSAGSKWDITRMIVTATMTSAGDDGKFMNLPKLSTGMYFRTKNGVTRNMFNARENSDFADESAGDISYPIRSGGGGTFGMRSRITFNGQDKRGVVKRLVLATSDEFQGYTRDNLTDATLIRLRTKIQGQVVLD
jgi:hypothetical protein